MKTGPKEDGAAENQRSGPAVICIRARNNPAVNQQCRSPSDNWKLGDLPLQRQRPACAEEEQACVCRRGRGRGHSRWPELEGYFALLWSLSSPSELYSAVPSVHVTLQPLNDSAPCDPGVNTARTVEQ